MINKDVNNIINNIYEKSSKIPGNDIEVDTLSDFVTNFYQFDKSVSGIYLGEFIYRDPYDKFIWSDPYDNSSPNIVACDVTITNKIDSYTISFTLNAIGLLQKITENNPKLLHAIIDELVYNTLFIYKDIESLEELCQKMAVGITECDTSYGKGSNILKLIPKVIL